MKKLISVAILTVSGLIGIARADNVNGAWSQVYDWPLISVHAALTPDGRVLTYGTNGDGKQTGFFIYDIWDPAFAPDSGHMTLNNLTLTDIFCSSQVILPQSGEILIAGGDNWTGTGTTNTGNNNSNIFDYGDNTLARSANMLRARWYSSATVMPDGSVYIQGGNGGADFPERRNLDGTFQLLGGASTSAYAAVFPRNFLAPDGRVFGYDVNGKMYFVSSAGTGSLVPLAQLSSASAGWTSGAAMFAPGKILQIGASGTVVIDITGPTPIVTPTQHTSTPRRWVSATVGPLGNVYATGGSGTENQMSNVNYSTEIWSPVTGTWYRSQNEAVKARLYHSAALLLPDASILVSGGGAPGPQVNTNAEIYYPPYLFNEQGEFAERPEIVSAPNIANAGDSLAVQVVGDISRVTLVKTGSVTHSVNMDQRFVELSFSASANMLQVDLPVGSGILPPGYYQMFVVNDEGVPSVGSMLRINIDANPTIAVDYTPTVGGAGGSPFQLACPADEIIVGIHGRQGTYVNQIGPKCVKVDQLGRWIGQPVDAPLTGTTTSGTSFSKVCPVNYAVDGFRANSGQYVNSIDISCRALTPNGGLTGAAQYLGGVGGAGGTGSGPLSCGTGNPVYALYGRSGGWLDSFGVQCRQAQITPISINSEPVVVNPGALAGTVGILVDITIQASDGDGDTLTFSATGLPAGLTLNTANGRIFGMPSLPGVYSVSVTVTDGTDSDTAQFSWDIAAALPLSVDPMPPQPAALVNTEVSYTASAQHGINRVYKWDFGDGTPETAYSSSPTVTHTFTEPGAAYVTLTVTDDIGIPSIQTFVQLVHLPLTANEPAHSSNIVYETRAGANDRVWLVNQDNDTVSVFDAVSNAKLAEIDVGRDPRTLAIAPDGRIWVTNKSDATISVIDPGVLVEMQTLSLAQGVAPYGIAFSPLGNEAYVVLEATGKLLKLDAATGTELGSADVGANPRHVSVESSGVRVFVSRHVTPRQPGEGTGSPQGDIGGIPTGGEIVPVDAASMTVLPLIVLRHSDQEDFENQGSGVPNYLAPLTISPDGVTASVASKQDNIARGTLINGLNLNFQNTVRAISSTVDMATLTEDYARRIDYDDASLASAIAYGPLGVYRFVALETSREIAVVDVHGGFTMFQIPTGRAPQGLVVSPDGSKLFVNNFMDRTLGVYDLTELYETGQWSVSNVATVDSVATETLDPEVLVGKQLFYDAADDRLARDNYMSCAVCHNDGGQDGRVWDLTGMGEGLRNTISLRGKAAAHGRLHWSQNFDEVQDFEGQIRVLSGGTGLMSTADFIVGTRSEPLGDPKAGISAELDALAAYVASLDEYPGSPFRNSDGSLTTEGVAGRDVFEREGCGSCHSGTEFTDSDLDQLHDIGTLKPTSGLRLNGPLTGIDTPTLRGAWATAPYLHDGSAASLSEAVAAHTGVVLNVTDMANLVAYLRQIDDNELVAPVPNTTPTITNPGDQSGETGTAVSLAIAANDGDGDTLSYSATGLPAGLSIDFSSGLISGTPDTAGLSNVTVTVSDGTASASTSFSWTLVEPNAAPTITNPGDQSGETGTAVSLAIAADDGDDDTLSYSATGLPAGLSIDLSSGLISGTPDTAGISNVTVTVSDGEDSAATSFSWTLVAPNTPPTITNPGDQTGEAGTAVSLAIDAYDADGDTLNFTATGLPAGLSINPGSGEISGTPGIAGASNVTVTVSDGEDSAATSFSWTLTDPIITPDPDDPDLVAWYRFDADNGGVITDASGNGNDGACSVGSTCPAFRADDGQPAGSMDFAGNGNYVILANEGQFDFTSNFSAALWMKAGSLGNRWAQLVGKGDSAWSIDRQNMSNNLTFTTFAPNYDNLVGTTNVADGEWHHVAIVYDGVQKTLYIDGEIDAQKNYSKLVSTNDIPVRLGYNAEYPTGQYSGLLDDVRIYKRALTHLEVVSLMTSGEPPEATIDGPADGDSFRAGDTIAFSGSATDAEDGSLAASAMSWEVVYHHNGQSDSVLTLANAAGGVFDVPTSGIDSLGDIRYEVRLTVVDSDGLIDTRSSFVYPERVDITLASDPSGVDLEFDGMAVNSPFVVSALVGYEHTLNAPDSAAGFDVLVFNTWSDGGARSHVINAPISATTYTATYVVQPLDPAADDDGDGLLNGFETQFGLNPYDPSDASLDGDNDGLDNLAEQSAGTDPTLADTDGDGASDGDEIGAGTDPLDPTSVPGPTDPDLVAWYRFDTDQGGVIADSSGSGNDGACSVGNTCPVFRTDDGQPSGSMDFAGNGNYVILANENQFDFTSNFSVALWMRGSNLGNMWAQLVGKGDSAWSIDRNRSSNNLQFTTWAPVADNLVGTANVADGAWHHVAIVYDGAQKTLYVDGEIDAQKVYSQLLRTNDIAVRLGYNAEYTSGQYSGLLDDVRIFKRALTIEEIRQIRDE